LKQTAEPTARFISATERDGFAGLIEAIAAGVVQGFEHVSVLLPYEMGRLVSLFHEKGHVEKLEHEEAGVRITGLLPVQLLSFFEEYVK
jgi:50S ribosomal subunit-associated GTPase HflX